MDVTLDRLEIGDRVEIQFNRGEESESTKNSPNVNRMRRKRRRHRTYVGFAKAITIMPAKERDSDKNLDFEGFDERDWLINQVSMDDRSPRMPRGVRTRLGVRVWRDQCSPEPVLVSCFCSRSSRYRTQASMLSIKCGRAPRMLKTPMIMKP